jgi:hypothetical protein
MKTLSDLRFLANEVTAAMAVRRGRRLSIAEEQEVQSAVAQVLTQHYETVLKEVYRELEKHRELAVKNHPELNYEYITRPNRHADAGGVDYWLGVLTSATIIQDWIEV